MSKENQLDLANYFPYLINRVGAVFVVNFTRDALDAEDLSIVMWRVLAALSNNGGQRQTDLAAMTSIEVSTLSRIVARLLKRGLITRERSPNDNREVAVALSPQGKTRLRASTKSRRLRNCRRANWRSSGAPCGRCTTIWPTIRRTWIRLHTAHISSATRPLAQGVRAAILRATY